MSSENGGRDGGEDRDKNAEMGIWDHAERQANK